MEAARALGLTCAFLSCPAKRHIGVAAALPRPLKTLILAAIKDAAVRENLNVGRLLVTVKLAECIVADRLI